MLTCRASHRQGRRGEVPRRQPARRAAPASLRSTVGRVIRELSARRGPAGRDITLTIDIGLQQYTQDRLGNEKSAAAVVMDVHTGGIYAMASNPSYDPNLFDRHQRGDVGRTAVRPDRRCPTRSAGQYRARLHVQDRWWRWQPSTADRRPAPRVFAPRPHGSGRPPLPCWKKTGMARSISSARSSIPRHLLLRSGEAHRHRPHPRHGQALRAWPAATSTCR